MAIARKSIHLKRNMQKGDLIKEEDLDMLRPGDGISPMRMEELLGKICQRDLSAGNQLKIEDIA
jgi:N-acetylneuraminate synthase/N,N'-diacetyllegionaminate synthase